MDVSSAAVVAWCVTHAVGVGVACLSRARLGGRAEELLRLALLTGMVGVSLVAYTTTPSESLRWVASGATLGLMVVAAVWEPHPESLAGRWGAHEPA